MATEPPLGEHMHSFGVVLHGGPANSQWLWIEFLHAVASAIGMSAVNNPAVWTYPVDGKGGSGQTIVLPITESFLALDTWPDHSGAYLFVCSCRPFDVGVIDEVARSFAMTPAPTIGGRFYSELNLK